MLSSWVQCCSALFPVGKDTGTQGGMWWLLVVPEGVNTTTSNTPEYCGGLSFFVITPSWDVRGNAVFHENVVCRMVRVMRGRGSIGLRIWRRPFLLAEICNGV